MQTTAAAASVLASLTRPPPLPLCARQVGTSKLQIPDSGALHINFQCSKPIMYQDTALSDDQFRMLWTNQVGGKV